MPQVVANNAGSHVVGNPTSINPGKQLTQKVANNAGCHVVGNNTTRSVTTNSINVANSTGCHVVGNDWGIG
ncbi:MAG: hypothetical protein ACKPGL_20830 [Dolichospermum sp.]